MFCQKCGGTLESIDRFCTKCGTARMGGETTPLSAPAKRRRGGRFIVGVVLILFALIGGTQNLAPSGTDINAAFEGANPFIVHNVTVVAVMIVMIIVGL